MQHRVDEITGQERRPIELVVLRGQRLSPQLLMREQPFRGDRKAEIGAGEHRFELIFRWHDGELAGSIIDAESVATELDRIALEQILFVSQRSGGTIATGAEARLQFVRSNRLTEFAQVVDQLANPGHHWIGGEEAIDVINRREIRRPFADARECAVGGGDQSLGSLLAAFHSSSIDAVTRASIQVRCVAVSGTVCAVVLGGLCDLRLAGDDGERGARSVAYGVPRCAGGGCPLAWWRRLCSDLTRAPTGARHLVCLLSLSASPACRPFRPPPPHRSAW